MSVTTDDRPDVNEMRVIHRVFRRELAALPGLVRAVPDEDVDRATVVGDHAAFMLDALDVHHTGEDDNLWPLLLERAEPSAELVRTMQSQHERVHECLGRTQELLGSWRRTASRTEGEDLADAVDELCSALFEHLDQEEREILPLAEEHLTVAEWARLGEHGRDSMSREQLPLMFGAIVEEATPAERDAMLSPLPPPVREFMETAGAAQYREYIGRVREG